MAIWLMLLYADVMLNRPVAVPNCPAQPTGLMPTAVMSGASCWPVFTFFASSAPPQPAVNEAKTPSVNARNERLFELFIVMLLQGSERSDWMTRRSEPSGHRAASRATHMPPRGNRASGSSMDAVIANHSAPRRQSD